MDPQHLGSGDGLSLSLLRASNLAGNIHIVFWGRRNIHEQLGWTSINSCHVNVLMWTRGKFTGLSSYKQPWTNNSTSHKPSTNHESSTKQASHIRHITISLLVARLALQSTQIWWQKHCKNHGFLIDFCVKVKPLTRPSTCGNCCGQGLLSRKQTSILAAEGENLWDLINKYGDIPSGNQW
jgi:hypothetical protein